MKIKQIIISITLIFTYCFSFSNVYGIENEYIYTPTEEEYAIEEEKQIEIMKAYYNRARENYTYDYRKVDSPATSSFSAYKVAYDQPSGGTIFRLRILAFFGRIVVEVQAHIL